MCRYLFHSLSTYQQFTCHLCPEAQPSFSTPLVVEGQSEFGLMQTLGSKQELREHLHSSLIPQIPFYCLR